MGLVIEVRSMKLLFSGEIAYLPGRSVSCLEEMSRDRMLDHVGFPCTVGFGGFDTRRIRVVLGGSFDHINLGIPDQI
jgi:hypothetical protein